MRATAVLAKGEFGWLFVSSDRFPRIEIQQDHAGDRSEVVHKVNQELVTYRDGQSQITVGIDVPPGDPVPGVDWTAGDEVEVDGSFQEVEALTSRWDDVTGRWVDVPQFGSILDEPDERIARNFRSLGGVNGGTSHLARPSGEVPRASNRPPVS